jgi:hypothetical protein
MFHVQPGLVLDIRTARGVLDELLFLRRAVPPAGERVGLLDWESVHQKVTGGVPQPCSSMKR